jgi:hypothetical protein
MTKRKQLQQPEEENKNINLYCPLLKGGGTRDIISCLYRCKKHTIIKCPEYTRIFPELTNFEIDEKYLEKYGVITIPIPLAFRKRRKRRKISAE